MLICDAVMESVAVRLAQAYLKACGRDELFEPISKKWRIYRRIGVGRRLDLGVPLPPASEAAVRLPIPSASRGASLASIAQQVLLERFAPELAGMPGSDGHGS